MESNDEPRRGKQQKTQGTRVTAQGNRRTAQGTRGTTAGGKINGSPSNGGIKHTPFCGSERKEEKVEDSETVSGGRGGNPAILPP